MNFVTFFLPFPVQSGLVAFRISRFFLVEVSVLLKTPTALNSVFPTVAWWYLVCLDFLCIVPICKIADCIDCKQFFLVHKGLGGIWYF